MNRFVLRFSCQVHFLIEIQNLHIPAKKEYGLLDEYVLARITVLEIPYVVIVIIKTSFAY